MKNAKSQRRTSSTISLTRAEWDFTNLPTEEWEVCQLWEYARESATILNICQRTREWAPLHLGFQERQEVVGKDFDKLLNGLGRSAILFQEGIYGFGGNEPVMDFRSPFPSPWQTLREEQKSVLIDTASWTPRKLIDIPGFRRAHPARTCLLTNFKPKPWSAIFEGNPSISEFAHAGGKLREICPNALYQCGLEVLAVEIDWRNHTNEELEKYFAKWLTESRPPQMPSPKSRGKRLNALRSSLDWLGISRVLNSMTKAEAEKGKLNVQRCFGTNRDWYRDRQKASRHFRGLFPFLPADEKLLCWETAGARNR